MLTMEYCEIRMMIIL